jgi:hypothetical protein
MLIHHNSMAIIFDTLITFNAREVIRFGSLSCITDQEGVLHRIAVPSESRSSPMEPIAPMNSKVRKPQPTFASCRIAPASGRPRAITTHVARSTKAAHLSRRTPLSMSPTRVWTRITRRKGVDSPDTSMAAGTRPMTIPAAPLIWETTREWDTTLSSFFLDVLFIQGRVEDAPISNEEPTILGEKPLQRKARQRRNRHCNIERHHQAGEQDPTQPVS